MNTHSIHMVDTTLRDGGQAPGVVFSLTEKIHIAQLLEKVGITELEAGTPAMGNDEINDIRTIIGQGFNFDISCWCRATANDLEAAQKTSTTTVNISVPASDIHLGAMGKDRNWVIATLRNIIKQAQQQFNTINIGAQDASRADYKWLQEIIHCAYTEGAHRVRIADTVGVLTPLKTLQLFEMLTRKFPTGNFEFHAHNDLGMAVANSLVATEAGCNSISTTVNGLGERAGNAAFEELVMALKVGSSSGIAANTKHLKELSDYVFQASGRVAPESKPITGDLITSHETGIHTRGMIANANAYQPFESELVGSKTRFIFGKYSGKASIRHLLESRSFPTSDEIITSLLNQVRLLSQKLKRSFNDDEVVNIATQMKLI